MLPWLQPEQKTHEGFLENPGINVDFLLQCFAANLPGSFVEWLKSFVGV
jgi:hypothetical protein